MGIIQKVIRCEKCQQITQGVDCTSDKDKYGCKYPQAACANGSAVAPGCMAERLEAERIKGRTEAMEFIDELVGVYRENDMINAADMLEREIDNFANC